MKKSEERTGNSGANGNSLKTRKTNGNNSAVAKRLFILKRPYG